MNFTTLHQFLEIWRRNENKMGCTVTGRLSACWPSPAAYAAHVVGKGARAWWHDGRRWLGRQVVARRRYEREWWTVNPLNEEGTTEAHRGWLSTVRGGGGGSYDIRSATGCFDGRWHPWEGPATGRGVGDGETCWIRMEGGSRAALTKIRWSAVMFSGNSDAAWVLWGRTWTRGWRKEGGGACTLQREEKGAQGGKGGTGGHSVPFW
jgi:hypothetical protein